MLDNAVLQAIHSRRSIRKFTDEPLSPEEIETILDAGRWAPSGLNNQPWRFLVVRRDDPAKERLEGCTKYAHIVRRADTLLVVALDKSATYSQIKDCQGAGACIQNMLLAAHSLGIGAVWLGEIINRPEATLHAAGLDPSGLDLMAVLALGRPAENGSSSRKPLSELILTPKADPS